MTGEELKASAKYLAGIGMLGSAESSSVPADPREDPQGSIVKKLVGIFQTNSISDLPQSSS